MALTQGFCAVPVIPFSHFDKQDIELQLVENYILKNRHLKDMKLRFNTDFAFLLKMHKQSPHFREGGDSSQVFIPVMRSNGYFSVVDNQSIKSSNQHPSIEEAKVDYEDSSQSKSSDEDDQKY